VIIKEQDYLMHYGVLRKSGRYPWGSGDAQSTRNRDFLDHIDVLRKQGLSDKEICEGLSTDDDPFTTSMLRAATTIAVTQQRQEKINMAQRLADEGWGPSAIGKRMDLSESSVRALLAPGAADKAAVLLNVANTLKKEVDEKKWLDVGTGVETRLDVSSTKLNAALAILKEEGYSVHSGIKLDQLGTGAGKQTELKMLVPPGVTWGEAARNKHNIQQVGAWSEDGGRSSLGIHPPLSISSKRLRVRYAEEGGADADGVIYVRPGVKDVSIGSNKYAQVRVAIDGSHYLKGMAIYKDDLPDGVDLVFNTNKSNTGHKLDALKELKRDKDGKVDKDNPFGAEIKRQIVDLDDKGGEKLTSSMNLVREEGDWDKWSRSLSSQILSKQSPDLARAQLNMTYEKKRQDLDEILALTNPTVKKKLLEGFADGADSAAVHLKAAVLPGSSYHVILPLNSIKTTEVYAPNFQNGTKLALIRSPHGGTFEIPELTVNNRNPEGRKFIKGDAKDALGIHPRVAERLSGADFDGDFVIAVPNDRGHIKSSPALEGLKGFDPKVSHPPYDGMKTIDGGTYDGKTGKVKYPDRADGSPGTGNSKNKQLEMGKATNLIADMSIQGATNSELAQAVRHSMVVIDAEKHNLDYKGSFKANGIPALKEKYQGSKSGGASTIVTRAKSDLFVNERKARSAKEGGPIDPETGKKVFVETGRMVPVKKNGVVVGERPKKTASTRLAEAKDAHELVSKDGGMPIEHVYADYSNQMKGLANHARREYVHTENVRYNPSAKATYSNEVASLDAKLRIAIANRPRERQAQALAGAVVSQRRQANPDMDKADIKKIKNQALTEMRHRTGADKSRIDITQEEWNAIQAGAISTHKLEDILQNTDLDKVQKLATPKAEIKMTSAKTARAQQMVRLGYTQAEIAAALGVSLTTLKTSINE
jgi:hypothetical protein